MDRELSDYLVFMDESGDHGLSNINNDYPIFVLCAMVIARQEYEETLTPLLDGFKRKYWGHADVVLHESEIRKPQGSFSILADSGTRQRFHKDLSDIMGAVEYKLISSVIKKRELLARYPAPRNPYDLSLGFVLERAFLELKSRKQVALPTQVTIESRGRNEDRQLLIAFKRIVDGTNACGRPLPFFPMMQPKNANLPGLQLVDLAARPIGLRALRPEQVNRAYEVLKPKICRNRWGRAEGWGVKLFP